MSLSCSFLSPVTHACPLQSSYLNRIDLCSCKIRGVYLTSQEVDHGTFLCRGGRLMLTILTFPYATAIGGHHAGKHCLQMLVRQPGPMGGEVCELIRERNPDSPLLRLSRSSCSSSQAQQSGSWTARPAKLIAIGSPTCHCSA